MAMPGCLLSGELDLLESGFELEKQGRVRGRMMLCAQAKGVGKQKD